MNYLLSLTKRERYSLYYVDISTKLWLLYWLRSNKKSSLIYSLREKVKYLINLLDASSIILFPNCWLNCFRSRLLTAKRHRETDSLQTSTRNQRLMKVISVGMPSNSLKKKSIWMMCLKTRNRWWFHCLFNGFQARKLNMRNVSMLTLYL
jgi:hypothetical protein